MAPGASPTRERMTLTRVFDAPRALVWRAWTDPNALMQWWGPQGFTTPICRIDLRVGGTFLICMQSPDRQQLWSGGEYHELVPETRIVFSMYFSDPQGNRVQPEHYSVAHEAIEELHDELTLEDVGAGRTRLTYRGNETMEDATASGQLEAWYQMLDKLAVLLAQGALA